MNTIRRVILFLYNGGLDPQSADPELLYERRIVAATILLLTPVALSHYLANSFAFATTSSENIAIPVGITLMWTILFLQAQYGWTRFAAHGLIAMFWLIPTVFIVNMGLNTSNWVFYLVLSMLALLLGGLRVAAFWTAIAIASIWVFVGLENTGYMEVGVRPQRHAMAVGISGSIIALMLFISGATFRRGQKQAEQRLRATVQRMGEEVETRRKAEENALAAERAKAVFLTTMSHELRTPLNGVIGAAQLMTNTPLNDEQQSLMDVITSSGELLLDLINNVLDLSKLEVGLLELELRPAQPKALVNSVILPLQVLAASKDVTLDVDVSADVPPWILCDPLRVQQVLLNLCGNALKFTHEGHISLSVERYPEGIEFVVSDTGVGISADAQDKLFQPFTQADSSTARKFGGTGLGLNIVKQLVELMQGSIQLDSELGQGARFAVRLPLQACEMSIAANMRDMSEPQAQTVAQPLKVLVTDDNAVNRMVASKILKRLSHEVVEAEDGVQALAMIQAQPIDVVLMDVQMPNMDGLTATGCIRALDAPLNTIPIIGLSANAQVSDGEEMLAAGMNEYLAKPVRIEQLATLLSRYGGARPNAD